MYQAKFVMLFVCGFALAMAMICAVEFLESLQAGKPQLILLVASFVGAVSSTKTVQLVNQGGQNVFRTRK